MTHFPPGDDWNKLLTEALAGGYSANFNPKIGCSFLALFIADGTTDERADGDLREYKREIDAWLQSKLGPSFVAPVDDIVTALQNLVMDYKKRKAGTDGSLDPVEHAGADGRAEAFAEVVGDLEALLKQALPKRRQPTFDQAMASLDGALQIARLTLADTTTKNREATEVSVDDLDKDKINWSKIPKQALIDTLRNFNMGPPNLSAQDRGELNNLGKQMMRSDRKDHFWEALMTEVRYQRAVAAIRAETSTVLGAAKNSRSPARKYGRTGR